MNKHDRDNLHFLMSLKSQEDWVIWAKECTNDDFLYALELIKTAQAECDVRDMEIDEAEQDEEGLDCTEALEIINRVKKGASK
jgi:hypothetical protein